MRPIYLLLLLSLAFTPAHAGWPPLLTTPRLLRGGRLPRIRPTVELPRYSSPNESLERSVRILSDAALKTSLLSKPSISPLEQNISHFIFTVSPRNSAPGLSSSGPMQAAGSGFVFAQRIADGTTRLWGLTTAAIAQQTGPDVWLTFHLSEKDPISFPARIVAQGSQAGSNAALIEVPQTMASVALPVLPSSLSKPSAALAYGFHNDGKLYKTGLSPFAQTSERGLAHTTPEAASLFLQGGLVVDENGHALGLYDRSYDATWEKAQWLPPWKRKRLEGGFKGLTFINEFTPFGHAEYLLKEYEKPHSAQRVLLFGGRIIGKIELNESIMQMEVWYNNATPATLEKNPFWSLYDLERFIPSFEHATRVFVHIAGPDGKYKYTYDINLKNGQVLQLENEL